MRDQCLLNTSELRLAQKVRTVKIVVSDVNEARLHLYSCINSGEFWKMLQNSNFQQFLFSKCIQYSPLPKKRRLRSKLHFVLIKSKKNVKFAKKLSICWFLAFEKTDFFLFDKELENANSGNISLPFSATIVILLKKRYFLFLLTKKRRRRNSPGFCQCSCEKWGTPKPKAGFQLARSSIIEGNWLEIYTDETLLKNLSVILSIWGKRRPPGV